MSPIPAATVVDRNGMNVSRQVRPRFRSAAAIVALVSIATACGSEESSAPATVVVPGTEQWTDTGIDLSIDDTLLVEADGEITPATPDVAHHGPNGMLDPAGRRYNVEGLAEADHAGLIGRIGEAGAPFQVGSRLVSKADTEGRLFLGINDGDVGNNAGEFTATITVNPSGIDPATLAVDLLLEDFNAQDAEGVAGAFGDDVAFTPPNSQGFVGADAASYWQGYFGRLTGERLAEAFHVSDGRTYFLVEFARPGGSSEVEVFDVEMDGDQLVRIGARTRNYVELVATRAVDDLYEAFNDQDLDALTEEFEGVTYRSPSGEEVEGAQAAERWADEFGSAITRTTGVFAVGDGPAVFVTERREPAGRSTAHLVEVEMSSGGQIITIAERNPRPDQ